MTDIRPVFLNVEGVCVMTKLIYALAVLACIAGTARADESKPQFFLKADGTVEQRVAKVENKVDRLESRIAELEKQLAKSTKNKTWVFTASDFPAWSNNLDVQNDPDLRKAFSGYYESVVIEVIDDDTLKVSGAVAGQYPPKLAPIPGDFTKLFVGYQKPAKPKAVAPSKVRYSVCVNGRCTVYEVDAGSPVPFGATVLSGASESAPVASSPCPTGGCGDACACVGTVERSGWWPGKLLGRRR